MAEESAARSEAGQNRDGNGTAITPERKPDRDPESTD
jgi:hypothetical protein